MAAVEPRIGYATASDGARIAYAVSGEGPPLVSVPAPPDNHIQLEWQDPGRRSSVEILSRHFSVVRFDGRGTGLSDRQVADFSLEARLQDLECVVDRLGYESVVLLSGSHGNQLTVAYAARHPERVSHVVAVNPFVRGEDFMTPEQLNLWRTMLATDFQLFTDALGAQMFGWGREEGPRYADFFRKAVDPATAMKIYDAMLEVDLTPLLPQVRASTLVIQSEDSGMILPDHTRDFISLLPNASFEVAGGPPHEGATPDVVRRIARFLGAEWDYDSEDASAGRRLESGLQTVLFTDIESHTMMMQRLGDRDGRSVLREYERETRAALRAFGGAELKAMGDGFMASFRSAQAALDCAIDLQRRFAKPLSDLNERLRVRVGLNAGEPIAEDGDLFGAAVIRAARIAALARGSEIFVANVVRELVDGKGYLFADEGQHALRGLDEPVRLWSLRWSERND
jgi:class 3 adenylate cyclase/pimeloyl-ACP methyl ester carboxylesterase